MDAQNLIREAVKAHGSQESLALEVGCSQQYVSLLLRGKVKISAEKAIAFERAGLSRHDLRPDLFGPRPAAPNGSAAA